MQDAPQRRSNRERTEHTRAALIEAARGLFVEKSYAETGTPEIVARAGVTRGALYHHFADKQELFRAVAETEAAAVASEIERASPTGTKPVEALVAGGAAFVAAMQVPGRTRLLLLDGPAVLGRAGMDAIDARHARRTLRQGLEAAIASGAIEPLPLDALTLVLSSAFDRAALAVESGEPAKDYEVVLARLVEGLRP
jgi:AcrR family transcriptional regulator